MGMSKVTMHRLAASGLVRMTGARRARRYLLRDVVLELARAAMADRHARSAGPGSTPTLGGGLVTPGDPAGAVEVRRCDQLRISSQKTGDQ